MTTFFTRQNAAFRNDLNRSAGALIGIAQGLLCDGVLNDDEIRFLKNWLEHNEVVATTWPGDVIYSRISRVLEDGIVTTDERDYLIETLRQLIGGSLDELAESAHATELAIDQNVTVTIRDSTFCLTGDFVFALRQNCEDITRKYGGEISKSVTKKVTYLVVGGLGSNEWKHGSFGLKIQKAIDYKRQGIPLSIIHEDQWASALF